PVLDGPGGRDNNLNEFWARNALLENPPNLDAGIDEIPLSQPAFAATTEALFGRTTTVFRLRGYNGEANDDRVELAAYSGTTWDNEFEGPKPRWDGEDRWNVTSLWLERGQLDVAAPRYRDTHAYVAQHVLVAYLDRFPIGSPFSPSWFYR